MGVVGEEEEQTFCSEEEEGYIVESSSGGCTDTEGTNGVGNYNANVRGGCNLWTTGGGFSEILRESLNE